MFGGVDFSQLCVISSVQVCGLLSAALARITEGRRWQDMFQRMFLALSGDCGLHDRSERVERPTTVDDVGNDPGGDGRDRDMRFQPSAVVPKPCKLQNVSRFHDQV